MKALYNGTLIHQEHLSLPLTDRALQYGDGLFETIYWNNERAPLLAYHSHRLAEGALKLGLKDIPTLTQMENDIALLSNSLQLTGPGRIKYQLWRAQSSGAGYTPTSNQSNFLVTAQSLSLRLSQVIERCGIGIQSIVNYHPLSRYKTLNALPYILAATERDQRQLDELILCDPRGYVSEGVYSNLFWIKDNVLYTPSLTTGCVGGVMRQWILDQAVSHQITIKEVTSDVQELSEASLIFMTNALGIRIVQQLEDKPLCNSHAIYETLKTTLEKLYTS